MLAQVYCLICPLRREARLVFWRIRCTICRVCDVTDRFTRFAIVPRQTTGKRQSSLIVRGNYLHASHLLHHRWCKIRGESGKTKVTKIVRKSKQLLFLRGKLDSTLVQASRNAVSFNLLLYDQISGVDLIPMLSICESRSRDHHNTTFTNFFYSFLHRLLNTIKVN